MRLLQVIADGRPGGGTTQALALMEDLRKLGHEVSLVCQARSYAAEEATKVGIQTFGIDFFLSRMDIRVSIKLKRIVQRIQPDLVHAHGGRAGYFLSLGPVIRKAFPTVYTVHGYHFLAKRWGIRHMAALAERQISRWADVTVYVSQYDRNLAKQWTLLPAGKRSAVVYNGIKPEDIPPRRLPDSVCIGFLGRLTLQKDPLLFVDIARMLVAEGYTAKIIGGGDLEEDVKKSVETYGLGNHIRLSGSLPRRRALTEISNVAVAVFPSRWEGLPIALLELMHMGVPIVAAHVSGTAEVIDEGVSGVLVRNREPSQYAEAIRRITQDTDYRDRMIENAKRVVAEKFMQQRVTEQYMHLYEELVSA